MIENKIAQSGLITLDLEKWMPAIEDIAIIDIKEYLFREMILREKDFRAAVAALDNSKYEGKIVGVYCSADAIVPSWAYMLIATKLYEVSIKGLVFGDEQAVVNKATLDYIQHMDMTPYIDERVVIKGCGDRGADDSLYLAITHRLLPVAKSIMYGEPCSTVPIYKQRKPQA